MEVGKQVASDLLGDAGVQLRAAVHVVGRVVAANADDGVLAVSSVSSSQSE